MHVLALLPAAMGLAGADFDPSSTDWNGGARFYALARQAGVRIERKRILDLSALHARVALLFLGPRRPIPESLERFVREGGRLAVADDVGPTAPFLSRFGISRRSNARASVAYGGVAHLPLAFPRREHILLWGVDSVVANHPAALRSPGRVPLLAFDGDHALLHVVPHGRGEVVALGDGSLFINQMLSFADNEHFARSFVRYLTRATPARPLWVLSGGFETRGELPSPLAPKGAAAVAAHLRALAEDGAYGVNAVGWQAQGQRPIPGIFMALSVFAGGMALLLLAALWGGNVPLYRTSASSAPGEPPLERAPRHERLRLAAALRREIEERLREGAAADAASRAALEAIAEQLPRGEADPLARRVSARRLRAFVRRAERALGPLAHGRA